MGLLVYFCPYLKLKFPPLSNYRIPQVEIKQDPTSVNEYSMSGLEVAGLVLGSLPLVAKGIQHHIHFVKDWGNSDKELKSVYRQLTTEHVKLCNTCAQLLRDIAPFKDIENMLIDPFGQLWQREEIEQKIRSRLWDSYAPFEKTVFEIQEALEGIK